MTAITLLLYTLGFLLALILLLLFSLLLIPFIYDIRAGYSENMPWFNLYLRWPPIIFYKGDWREKANNGLKGKLIMLGIPINVDFNKNRRKNKEKITERKKIKMGQKKPFLRKGLLIIDRNLLKRGKTLIIDLLQIIKPEFVLIDGKIGFDEPHLNGWLAAFVNTIDYGFKPVLVKIKPVWEEECFEMSVLLRGHMILGLVLVKISFFLLRNYSANLICRIQTKDTLTSA